MNCSRTEVIDTDLPVYTKQRSHLDFPEHPGALHPTGHIHAVAPDVVLRFLGTDDAGDHWPVVDP